MIVDPVSGGLSAVHGMWHWTLQSPCTQHVFLAPSHKREQNVIQGFSRFPLAYKNSARDTPDVSFPFFGSGAV